MTHVIEFSYVPGVEGPDEFHVIADFEILENTFSAYNTSGILQDYALPACYELGEFKVFLSDGTEFDFTDEPELFADCVSEINSRIESQLS